MRVFWGVTIYQAIGGWLLILAAKLLVVIAMMGVSWARCTIDVPASPAINSGDPKLGLRILSSKTSANPEWEKGAKTMPRKSIEERLAQIEAQRKTLKARLGKQERSEDTRRKILLGALVLNRLEISGDGEFSKRLGD